MHSPHVKRPRLNANGDCVLPRTWLPGSLGRRSVLQVIGRAGLAAMLAPGLSLLRSDRAKAAREPLRPPREIRSRDGELDVTLSAESRPAAARRCGGPRISLQRFLPPAPDTGAPRGRAAGQAAKQRPGRLLQSAFPRSQRIAARAKRQRVRPRAARSRVRVRGEDSGRRAAGAWPVLVSPAWSRFCHQADTRWHCRARSWSTESETLFPILKDLPERFLLIKHVEPGGGREVISINGQMNPAVEIRPGEMQFWRIANIGATLFSPVPDRGHAALRDRNGWTSVLAPAQDRASFSSARASASMRSRSVRRPANTPWARSVQEHGVAGPVSGPADRHHRVRRIARAGDAEAQVLRQRVARPRWIDEVRASPIVRQRRARSIRARRTAASS